MKLGIGLKFLAEAGGLLMKNLNFAIFIFFVAVCFAFTGCDNPAVLDFLDELRGREGINIKNGDADSTLITFNSIIDKYEMREVEVGEEVQELPFYEFVDPNLDFNLLNGLKIMKDDEGEYVMLPMGADLAFTGEYEYIDGNKTGQVVPAGTGIFGNEEDGYYVMEEIETVKILNGYKYSDGKPVPSEKIKDIKGTEETYQYLLEVVDINHVFDGYYDNNNNPVDPEKVLIGGETGFYIEQLTSASIPVLIGYFDADNNPVDPAKVRTGGPTGFYIEEFTGNYKQVETGEYQYANGVLVENMEIQKDGSGSFVFHQGWIESDITSITIPSGNGSSVSVVLRLDETTSMEPFLLYKTSGNQADFRNYNSVQIRNISYSADNIQWNNFTGSSFPTSNGIILYIKAEIYFEGRIEVYPVIADGDPIMNIIPVYAVYEPGDEEYIIIIPVHQIFVDIEIYGEIIVIADYTYNTITGNIGVRKIYIVIGGDPVRKAVRKATRSVPIFEMQQVVVGSEEKLIQQIYLYIGKENVGSAVFNVNKNTNQLSVNININALIPFEPEIKYAYAYEERFFEDDEFTLVIDRVLSLEYIPGSTVYLEIRYKFQ